MLLPDIADTVNEFAIAVTVTPPGAVQTVNGYKNKAAGTPVASTMAFQPMTPKEVERLPEGERSFSWFVGYTTATIGINWLINDGIDTYQSWRVEDWREAGGYYRVQCKRVTGVPT